MSLGLPKTLTLLLNSTSKMHIYDKVHRSFLEEVSIIRKGFCSKWILR